MFGITVHLPVAVFICTVYLQGGKALQVFQEVVAQRGILPPVFAQKALCKFLHCHDRERDKRHTHHQHHSRTHAYRAQRCKQCDRRQHTVKKLRQISAEIGFQLLGALPCKLHHLCSGHVLRIGRPQAQQFAVDKPAQGLFHLFRGIKGSARRPFCAQKTHQGRGSHHGRHTPEHNALCTAPKQGMQKQAQHKYHGNVGGKGTPLQGHILRNIFFAAGHHPHQPFVQHLLPLSIGEQRAAFHNSLFRRHTRAGGAALCKTRASKPFCKGRKMAALIRA